MKIKAFFDKKDNLIKINWDEIEKDLGFFLHENLKDFYSKKCKNNIQGYINLTEDKFIEKTGNEKFDTWFSFNDIEGEVEYIIETIQDENDALNQIKNAFKEWTGGNDFGHRAYLGDFFTNIGVITILFNNDTGKIEWIDCDYGNFKIYDENPNGILANNLNEFVNKLIENEVKI